jgi:hypothetical protein
MPAGWIRERPLVQSLLVPESDPVDTRQRGGDLRHSRIADKALHALVDPSQPARLCEDPRVVRVGGLVRKLVVPCESCLGRLVGCAPPLLELVPIQEVPQDDEPGSPVVINLRLAERRPHRVRPYRLKSTRGTASCPGARAASGETAARAEANGRAPRRSRVGREPTRACGRIPAGARQ